MWQRYFMTFNLANELNCACALTYKRQTLVLDNLSAFVIRLKRGPYYSFVMPHILSSFIYQTFIAVTHLVISLACRIIYAIAPRLYLR